MNIQKDIEKKNTSMKIDTPPDNNVPPPSPSPPMSVEQIIIIVFTCVFAVMLIIFICLSIFTKILTPIAIESYMLIFFSFCFLIFLIFSLINPIQSDYEDDEEKEDKDIFNRLFQTMYYVSLVCGTIALVGFIIINFVMFFGILGLIDLFDIIFHLIMLIEMHPILSLIHNYLLLI